MSASGNRRRRRGGVVLIVLLALGGFAAFAISAFQVGVLSGLGLGGGALVIYMVPATIFDWPRITWDDITGIVGAVLAAVAGFFASLFGW